MKYYLSNSYELLQATNDCGDCMICPQKLYLDITQDCNLWCRMCRDKRDVSGRTMPIDLFKRIVDETSPYVRSYSLFNWGEPLLVKDFCERVCYVNQRKRQDCNVEISTNGTLLSDQMINFLAANQIKIAISVDGANKTTFEQIRRGANFEQVMRNAKETARAYGEVSAHELPEFYVSIQKENQNQILDIIKLGFSLGIRRFGFGIVTSPPIYAPDQNQSLCDELEQAYQFIDDHSLFLSVYPTKIGDYIYVDGKYQNAAKFVVNTVCNAALVSATIDYKGDIYLCCNVGDCVGNLSNFRFLDVWKSERYNQLRNDVNSLSNMPQKCKECAWFNRN